MSHCIFLSPELCLEFEVNKEEGKGKEKGKEEIQGDVLGFTGELLKRRMVAEEGDRIKDIGDRIEKSEEERKEGERGKVIGEREEGRRSRR